MFLITLYTTWVKLVNFFLQSDQPDLHVAQVLLQDLLHQARPPLLRLLQAAQGRLVQGQASLGGRHQHQEAKTEQGQSVQKGHH